MKTNLPAKREDVTTTFKEFYMQYLNYVHCHPMEHLGREMRRIADRFEVWDESTEMKQEHYDKFLR